MHRLGQNADSRYGTRFYGVCEMISVGRPRCAMAVEEKKIAHRIP